ncbi:hypothetical protein [Rhizobium miluonense]|uniref:Uncharacterized protein n=1 Tax=Rhizobium miluonense TaxID=411945 RepID=A0A1C3XCG4_9HYPH|nr:hypothetical protein [Rhizobium miluonense]SCB49654.1 hypothetical protein GA0061102_10779 [Rhizobium miluonense]
MNDTLTLGDTVTINTVVWITSLKESEQGVTNRILEDLEPELRRFGIDFIEREPKTAAELLAFLDDLEVGARERGVRPIIHIDTHGNKNLGIHINASDEFVSWGALIERMRAINVATECNLCVVSMACFGFHLLTQMRMGQASPFYLLAGSDDLVYVHFIQSACLAFYRDAFEQNDIIGAYRTHLMHKLRIMHSESMIFNILVGYVRAECLGENRERRINQAIALVEAEAKRDGTTINVAVARKTAEELTTPTQRLVDEQVGKFLLGRKVSFTIEDVIRKAETIEDPYAATGRPRPKTELNTGSSEQ